MKNLLNSSVALISLAAVFVFAAPDSQKSLADIYKTGKVRLVQELTLDDSSMPKDVFFNTPFGVICDTEGSVYICDYRANDIKKFDASGKFVKIIGRKGQGPGEFNGPFHMTFAKDRLVVWDSRNSRLCSLTPDGEFIKSAMISRTQGFLQKLRSLPDGDIVIEMEKIYFGEPNRAQDCTIEIFSLGLEHKRTIYSHEVLRNKFIRGDFGVANVPQPFTPHVYWDVAPDGKIIIGFSEKYEIEIHDSIKGKISTFSHSCETVKVTKEDEKAHFAGMSFSRGGESTRKIPDYIVKNTKFPKHKPAFYDILVDSEGNILVPIFRKNRAEMSRYFDAFDPEGNFIANVQVVGDIPLPRSSGIYIKGQSFWLPRTGEDDLYKIIRYKISN